jgi:hypothetical protein
MRPAEAETQDLVVVTRHRRNVVIGPLPCHRYPSQQEIIYVLMLSAFSREPVLWRMPVDASYLSFDTTTRVMRRGCL